MRTADRSMGNQAVVGQFFGDQPVGDQPSENLEAEIFGSYDTSPHMEGDRFQFEYFEDGKRMYCGREIPPEAPPSSIKRFGLELSDQEWGMVV